MRGNFEVSRTAAVESWYSYPRNLVDIHPLVERHMAELLPILCQPVVRYKDELRRHVVVC
jgi:hypothetical protein